MGTDLEHFRARLVREALGLIASANGGGLPVGLAELEGLFARFGVELRWVDREILSEPLLSGGVVCIPDVRPDHRNLAPWLAHELAEAVVLWDGGASWQAPGRTSDRHAVACRIEAALLAALE